MLRTSKAQRCHPKSLKNLKPTKGSSDHSYNQCYKKESENILADETVEMPLDENLEKDEMVDDSELKSLGTINLDQTIEDVSSDLRVSTSNASVETTIEIPIVSNVIPMHTSPLADVQELDARALSTKKNIPREKPINVQALADMKWFKHIQRFSAPESDPLGHLPKHMDFLVAHVHNLGKSLPDKFVDYVNSVLPRLIIDTLEERLPELFSYTTKNHFSQLLTESIKENLPGFNKRIRNALHGKMLDILEESFKPINK
ncbi:hypothetical protein Tco_1343796 [Tanacetum coccineum]